MLRGIFSWLIRRKQYSMAVPDPDKWEPLARHVASSVRTTTDYMFVMSIVRGYIVATGVTEPTQDVWAATELAIREVSGATVH